MAEHIHKTYSCDRCGTDLGPMRPKITLRSEVEANFDWSDGPGPHFKWVDLCAQCDKDVKEFFGVTEDGNVRGVLKPATNYNKGHLDPMLTQQPYDKVEAEVLVNAFELALLNSHKVPNVQPSSLTYQQARQRLLNRLILGDNAREELKEMTRELRSEREFPRDQ